MSNINKKKSEMHFWLKIIGAKECLHCGVIKRNTTIKNVRITIYTFKDGSEKVGGASPNCKETFTKQRL